MNVVVFDTETIGLDKSFCYNIGLVVLNTDTKEIALKEDFVVEQIWNNKPLFETAYYTDKKDIYINRMKGGTALLKKFGHITQHLAHIFEEFDIKYGYAYNSPFDDKVMKFNCEWFKCINPFDNIKLIDIRGLVHQYIAFTPEYQKFCEKHKLFTESGNYSTTAEALFKYLFDVGFEEEHTALADSIIECEILQKCIELGGIYGKDYKIYATVPRKVTRPLKVIYGNKTEYERSIEKAKVDNTSSGITITLKDFKR